ncbi:hypothetical protein SC09_Contig26orf00099 [Bacillus subtilis]|uniref:Uncharacterized protein n=1 Tax=Bacillus subtilis TaxID=1423 RepID=A0A0D1KVR3_BACIU|nr:hypothetical protein SC09_Contig26orf00099 [Bacillus subtilis]
MIITKRPFINKQLTPSSVHSVVIFMRGCHVLLKKKAPNPRSRAF